MLAGLLWKPWTQGNTVLRRKRANTRKGLILRVVYTSFDLLGEQFHGLASRGATPLVSVLLKWSRALWQNSRCLYARVCALACLSLVQDVFKFNLELAPFFRAYGFGPILSGCSLVAGLAAQRKKRFMFVKQRPKRFILWYWGSVLAQYAHTPTLQRKPLTVLRVLHPVSFFLKKKKLKR